MRNRRGIAYRQRQHTVVVDAAEVRVHRCALDGRTLRLPDVVARPRAAGSGLKAAFMSELLHAPAAAEAFTCPVNPCATAWWMSQQRCAEDLVHAGGVNVQHADSRRAWPMPVLRAPIGQLSDATTEIFVQAPHIRTEPDQPLEAVFGRYPRLDDAEPRTFGLGCAHDVNALMRRVIGALPR